MSKVFLIGGLGNPERPQHIPNDWTIYNAPRPLYGNECWEGDFVHGRFYAAVEPQSKYHQLNQELDGWPCVWISKEEVVEWFSERLTERGISKAVADYPYEDVARMYYYAKQKEAAEAVQ